MTSGDDGRSPGRGHTARALAALAIGTALGATAAGGTALLLYTGQGFIRAAGLLVSSTVMAVAAGIWAGTPDAEAARDGAGQVSMRARWTITIIMLIAAGLFAAFWSARAPFRSLALGGAVAVLLLLALPAYAAGSLLAGLQARDRARLRRAAAGGIAPAAVAGAATGVLLATAVLIQNTAPEGIYYGAAVLLSLTSLLDRWRGPHHVRGEDEMLDHATIITGVGARGQLGYALAARFAQAGARVMVTSRSPDIYALAEELSVHGRVQGVQADLSAVGAAESVVESVRREFGRLDSLVNSAGGLSIVAPVADTTPEQWQHETERNAGTALRMSRAALPLLRESHGAVVNFASLAADQPVAGLAAYSAAKAAVLALTRTLALEEAATGVRVNAVTPGLMDTDQNRAAAGDVVGTRFVARDDVASVVLFLAGPASRGVTGETVTVTVARVGG
ncbi:MAG: SDR family oxidoreductase [Gemmatimonadota bacterium]